MTTNPIRVLYIEDDPNDMLLVQRFLAQPAKGVEESFQLEGVDRLSKAVERMAQGDINLILADLGLPDASELDAVVTLHSQYPAVPIIALTHAYAEELGSEAVKKGAQDYLLKDSLSGPLLRRCIRYAIERMQTQQLKISDLNRLNQLKDDFISTVSHELRTPLTVMGLGLENLQAGILGALNEKQAQAVERNVRNAKHLGKLIDDLLDLSRLQSGRAKIERKGVDLRHLIHEVIQNFQTAENGGGASIQEEMAADLASVECDPDLIAQVATNLLSNAIRYAKSRIVVKTEMLQGAFQVSVANDGPGIAKEKAAALFEKFVQLDRESRTGSYKGTGLGLAISKEIIARHGGKIWVESPGEEGVVFYFTLPAPETENDRS